MSKSNKVNDSSLTTSVNYNKGTVYKFKQLTKDIDSIDFNRIYTIMNETDLELTELKLDIELFNNLDKIISDNVDMLSTYKIPSKYVEKLYLQHSNLYNRHGRYEPLAELNITPLTRYIYISRIFYIILEYKKIFDSIGYGILLKQFNYKGYTCLVLLNQYLGCVNGYIGNNMSITIPNTRVNTIDITFTFNNKFNLPKHWIGFDTLHLGDTSNLKLSKRYINDKEILKDVVDRYNRFKSEDYKEHSIVDVSKDIMVIIDKIEKDK
jgi:hypothetical protein